MAASDSEFDISDFGVSDDENDFAPSIVKTETSEER